MELDIPKIHLTKEGINMKSKTISWLITSLFSYSVLANVDCESLKGQTFEAAIIKVADGDTATVKLKKSGRNVKVRFFGVDTPETKWSGHWPEQPYSVEAKIFTVTTLNNKNVKVTFTGDRTYSRCVGEIFTNGQSHSLALINGGYAWWYSKYAPNRSDLKDAQVAAKQSKRGLWANSNAQAPWDFRKHHNNG